jgi:hypothetical protein
MSQQTAVACEAGTIAQLIHTLSPDGGNDADGHGGEHGAKIGEAQPEASGDHSDEEKARGHSVAKPKKSAQNETSKLLTQLGVKPGETVVNADGKCGFFTNTVFLLDLVRVCPAMTELSLKGNQILDVDDLAQLIAEGRMSKLVKLHLGKYAFRILARLTCSNLVPLFPFC